MSAQISFLRLNKEFSIEDLKQLVDNKKWIHKNLNNLIIALKDLQNYGICTRDDAGYNELWEIFHDNNLILDTVHLGGWDSALINLNALKVDRSVSE
jgi:ribonuclease HIII